MTNGEVMGINIEDIRSGSMDGDTVFICDYRQEDLNKKPIRNVKPQEVFVCGNDELPENKKIYYSDSHFRAKNKDGSKSSKIIPLFDNTGFRSFAGVALEVFDNMEECAEAYRCAVISVIDRLEEKKKTAVKCIDDEISRLRIMIK